MPGLVKVSYLNASGSAVPPFGIVQMNGAATTTGTNDLVLPAIQPDGTDNQAFLIDDGKGCATSGPQSYGNGFRMGEGCGWVLFSGDQSALTPWQEVGPRGGSFAVSDGGKGYFYAGISDPTNGRIQVIAKPVGPGSPRIHFSINSINYSAGTANCTILEKTCGATLKGLNSNGSVTVYDTAGCWLVQPTVFSYTDCNLGRQGWADYMEIYGYPGSCRWIISSMCPFGCVLVVKDFTCNSDGTITKIQTPVVGCC